ncbi:hypothetical protein HRbin32_01962 [bacterium HR32]|nr:hypothetical protein HRbin32_01962 [bacterium HR32]
MRPEVLRGPEVQAQRVHPDPHHVALAQEELHGVRPEPGEVHHPGAVRVPELPAAPHPRLPPAVHEHRGAAREPTVPTLPSPDVVRRHLGVRVPGRPLVHVHHRHRGDEHRGRQLVHRARAVPEMSRGVHVGADVLEVAEVETVVAVLGDGYRHLRPEHRLSGERREGRLQGVGQVLDPPEAPQPRRGQHLRRLHKARGHRSRHRGGRGPQEASPAHLLRDCLHHHGPAHTTTPSEVSGESRTPEPLGLLPPCAVS